MDESEFENSLAVKYWMDSLPGKDTIHSTKYTWKHHFKKFCEWIGKTPDQLVSERKEHLKSDDHRVRHQAEMDVKRFLNFLQEKGLSPNTRRSYFMAIRNFYKRNYLEMQFFRGDGPRNETVQEGARASSKEDIGKMIEVSGPRERALILFIKDTGLAESDVAKLKLKDLGIKEVSEIFQLEASVPIIVNRKKTGRRTITFVGKESLEALKNTFRIRQVGSAELKIRRYGHLEVKGGIPPETLTLDSPLFRSYGKFLRTLKKPTIDHLSPHAISVIIRKAAIQAGVWSEGFSAHALRRFFQTSLETSGMNQNWIKKMMGHTLGGSEAPYSRPEVEMLREAYQRSYPHLAISEAVEQRSRIETLEAQVEALQLNGKRKDESISSLKQQLLERTTNITEKIESLETLLRRIEQLEKKLAQK